MDFTCETRILAPREAVFGVLTDAAQWPAVLSAITAVEVLPPGPVWVGTRLRETRVVSGRTAVEDMTVTELKAPEHFVLEADSHGVRSQMRHTLTGDGDATRLRIAVSMQPMTIAARLAMPLLWMMKRRLVAQIDADLADLKRVVEVGR